MKLNAGFRAWRNRTSIRTQLSLAISAVIIVLFSVLLVYNYVSQYRANVRHETTAIEHTLELETQQLSAYIDELATFSLQLRNDSAFMSILTQNVAVTYEHQSTIENSFRTQFYSRNDLQWMELHLLRHGLSLRMDNPRRKILSIASRAPEAFEDCDVFSAPPAYLSIQPSESGFLQVSRMIINSPHSTQLAVVRFLVDNSFLDAMIKRHRAHEELVCLFDEGGAAYTRNGCEQAVIAAIAEGKNLISLGGVRYLLAPAAQRAYGLTIAILKPMSVINASLHQLLIATSVMGLCAVLLVSLVIFGLIHMLTQPLSALAERMQEVGSGNFQSRADLQGSLEMTGLSEEANRMIANISALIDQTYVSSLNERTAQLAALQAQTNPHFLFNTLQAISTEAILAGDNKVYRLITTLSSMLRYTIKGGNFADLSSELDHVRRYLTIQKARFGDRLEYDLRADEALLHKSFPKLSLLSLVENSIVHGMKGEVDKIHLSIECLIQNGVSVICVQDDGAGIPPDQLADLRRIFQDENVVFMQKIGLSNLASRLRLLYDGQAFVEIDSVSSPSRQTSIRILIPMEVLEHAQHLDH
ncbi:MAG: sensor histidine kinase [Candidatus Ventricola sp.]